MSKEAGNAPFKIQWPQFQTRDSNLSCFSSLGIFLSCQLYSKTDWKKLCFIFKKCPFYYKLLKDRCSAI